MKNNSKQNKRVMYATLLLLVVSSFTMMTASADPTVTVDPTSPYPQSTVTFTANQVDEDATSVRIIVQECNENTGVCYPDETNETMTQKTADSYDITVTLKQKDATYIQYTLLVENNGELTQYSKLTKVTLSEKPSDNGGDTDNDTPGFEFVGLAFSIMFISLILYRRKR